MKGDRGPLSWPLCHCALLSSLPDLSGDLGNHSKALSTRPLCLYHSSGVFFNRQEAFIISIPLNNDFSYLGCCNLMTVIICCCNRKMKGGKNCRISTPFTQRISKHLMKKKRHLTISNFSQSKKKSKIVHKEMEFEETVVLPLTTTAETLL